MDKQQLQAMLEEFLVYVCPLCRTVHAGMPAALAEPGELKSLMRCSRCGCASALFVLASPEDCPPGLNELPHCVVLRGVLPGSVLRYDDPNGPPG
jgi:hypothetical protein